MLKVTTDWAISWTLVVPAVQAARAGRCRCRVFNRRNCCCTGNTGFGPNVFDHWSRTLNNRYYEEQKCSCSAPQSAQEDVPDGSSGHFPQTAPGSEGWARVQCFQRCTVAYSRNSLAPQRSVPDGLACERAERTRPRQEKRSPQQR